MKEKQAVTGKLRKKYGQASKTEKGEIIDWLVEVAGYNRKYAATLLRNGQKKKTKQTKPKPRSGRPPIYDEEVFLALRRIWFTEGCICGKRLAPFLKELVPILKRFGEIDVTDEVEQKLANISPATVDRLLKPVKAALNFTGKSSTKPGTLLKSEIPIKTFSEWDDTVPGYVEVDLVAHNGGDPSGEFAYTLDVTDVATGWTETRAVKNKARVWVSRALEKITDRLPFEIKGIDSDNGSEFINDHLLNYCQEREITFTRSRPYRKNDNCYIEQKNWSVVRKTVGYRRHDTDEERVILNKIYKLLRPYTNYFQPSLKLVEKERSGAKVTKRYDKAKTPYRRLLAYETISQSSREKLKEEYFSLNPAQLNREIESLRKKLYQVYRRKGNEVTEKQEEAENDLEYILS
ncbi:transposase family protein [Candidatus Bipolaricaulota bacterium]|nr:transposase family protein [Candidatus Bipolaricaulota bacterium]